MSPNEFLEYAGTKYNENKKKWSTRLKKEGLSFNDDIYQDTILHIYDHLCKQDYTDDIDAYWYQSFLNNIRREKEYAYNDKRDDEIDPIEYLKDTPVEERGILLSDIEDGIKSLNDIDRHLFFIYYLTDITYKELEDLTNIKDMKYRIKKIRGTIKK